MNKKIEALREQLEQPSGDIQRIQKKMQEEYNKVFDDSKSLAKDIANAESASMYQLDESGEVESWFRFDGLDDIPEDAREFFDTWLSENHCMRVDWDNSCFLYSQGESITINDDGDVFLGHKCVIHARDYRSEDRDTDTDELERNRLIEAYMERSGYFPGVFSVDRHGNVFYVDTKPKAEGGAA